MTRIIEVIISPKGETKIETKGYSGSSCQAASKFLEDALGAKTSDLPTAELYQTQPATQQIQHKGNS
jgi:hypothetical protein